MKHFTKSLLLLLLIVSISSYAQTTLTKFQSAIKKGLALLDSASAPAEYVTAANYFERIAQAEPKEWLPSYYVAYSNLTAGLMTRDKLVQDQYFDKAMVAIAQANAISADNSEIYLLKGYIQFMKMSVDPQARLAFMGASAEAIGKAKVLNADNPRIYLVNGQNTFYTPEAFGGGKLKAKPILENAVAKFATFKPANEIAPQWGSEQATALLAKCN